MAANDSGFTLIQQFNHTKESSAVEYEIAATTAVNLNVKFGSEDGPTNKWAMIVTGIT